MKRRKDTEYVDTYQRYVTVPNMVVAPADHEQAMAEKDREIQQIREHEFQRGYQEAEEKYQQIYEGGCPHDSLGDQARTIEQQAQEIARLREALENIVEGEGLWTKNDMAHEAQQALKETGK